MDFLKEFIDFYTPELAGRSAELRGRGPELAGRSPERNPSIFVENHGFP